MSVALAGPEARTASECPSVALRGQLRVARFSLIALFISVPLLSGAALWSAGTAGPTPLRQLVWVAIPVLATIGIIIVAVSGKRIAGYHGERENTVTKRVSELEHLALTDGLTGLGNNRSYRDTLRREVARAARHDHPVTLALIDIDRFKSINDSGGHAQGDRALVKVAKLLDGTRSDDRAYRIGGDEFAVILSHATHAAARAIVGRLHAAAADAAFGATLSIGTATLGLGCGDGQLLHQQADVALYEAKRRGRNMLVAFEDINLVAPPILAAQTPLQDLSAAQWPHRDHIPAETTEGIWASL